MEIHQIRALDAIVSNGSYLAAAAQLDQSQSSLSHAVSTLEKELGVRLLERGRHGAKPTEAGRRVLPHLRQILTLIELVRAETACGPGLITGRVRVGSIPSAAVSFLPKVIARFTRAFPGVEVVLLEEPSQSTQTLETWLHEYLIDIALVQLPAPGVKSVMLMRDELCAILPARSGLAKLSRVSVRELGAEPFIMSRYTSVALLNAAFARYNLSPRIRFEVQDRETLISMVREGLGFSIVPQLAFPGTITGTALVPMAPRIRRELGLAIRHQESALPTLDAFIRCVKEVAARRFVFRRGTRRS
jgi:DNA-binding transcriptional LysR family regulator